MTGTWTIKAGEATALAQEMVRIPSVTGREGREISEFVGNWLRAAGFAVTLDEIAPGRVNVVGRLDGKEPGPRLLVNGHLDTKPFEGMTIDPVGAEIRDGKLWGRGACDMKGPIAAMMVAAKAVLNAGGPVRGTLLVGCEVGEEGGGWTLQQLFDSAGACDAVL